MGCFFWEIPTQVIFQLRNRDAHLVWSFARYLPITLWQTNIAIEHGHRNSGFSHKTWWFSIVMLVYQRVNILNTWDLPWQTELPEGTVIRRCPRIEFYMMTIGMAAASWSLEWWDPQLHNRASPHCQSSNGGGLGLLIGGSSRRIPLILDDILDGLLHKSHIFSGQAKWGLDGWLRPPGKWTCWPWFYHILSPILNGN